MSKPNETLIGTGVCPFCGNDNRVKVTDVELTGFGSWRTGQGQIQEVMPYLPADKREVLISGICISCQKEVFV